MGLGLLEDKSLQGLHDVGHQFPRPVVLGATGTRCLRHRNEAGRLPELRDPLKTQAHVEDTVKHSTEMGGTGFEHLGADTIGVHSLALKKEISVEGRPKRNSQSPI
ncbi:unnamed protein product [Pleuronectes platessa]|uniref:Uncharacterized protein n=1 Tax=Pleuronectes platessa TaxID=8262 RepID=A0A9N7YWU7_PLEPL|nr:unnamed protein product [Pleuronectes platessa]